VLDAVRAVGVPTPDLKDRVWAARIRAGDVAAFEAVFRQLAAPLQVFVKGYVGSADVAEEVVQDIFFGLWRQRESLDLRASILTYLYISARNRAISHLKRERVASGWRASTPPPDLDAAPTIDDDLVEAELSVSVQRAIDHLPERTRQVFTLSRHQHLSYGAIAAAMGISIKTVETQMGRALRILREHLGPLCE
jgi:RNA polymerase sigma-70 factor (ECF subfamily)